MVQTNLRVPKELKTKLRKEADQQGISLNQLIIHVLHRRLSESDHAFFQIL